MPLFTKCLYVVHHDVAPSWVPSSEVSKTTHTRKTHRLPDVALAGVRPGTFNFNFQFKKKKLFNQELKKKYIYCLES